MSKLGKRLINAAKSAQAIAKGEADLYRPVLEQLEAESGGAPAQVCDDAR